jgi:hypothetical protein
MFEALAAALHLGVAEPLAQPARGRARYHYSRRHHARPRAPHVEEKEPEGVWPVLDPKEPRITMVPVQIDGASFEQRWAPMLPLMKGDRLDRGK